MPDSTSDNSASGSNLADNIVVVTGTDTEIGKTLVCEGLVRNLRERGVDVRAVKPVESGTDELKVDERDATVLARAAGQEAPRRALDELSRPLAPPTAAEIDGVELDMQAWVAQIRNYAAESQLVVVEGAGGVLSPLTWEETARELAAALGAPAVLVAPNQLGVLTHTLTAIEALEAADVPCAGVVYSAPADPDEASESNAETLRRFAGIERIAEVPRLAGGPEAAEYLDAVANWILQDLEGP